MESFLPVLRLLREQGLGDLDTLILYMEQNGLGTQVLAWLAGQAAPPLMPQAVQELLGPEVVATLARRQALSPSQAALYIAAYLPAALRHLASTLPA
jgi:uncharacterized protein YidB (DUF937 family)